MRVALVFREMKSNPTDCVPQWVFRFQPSGQAGRGAFAGHQRAKFLPESFQQIGCEEFTAAHRWRLLDELRKFVALGGQQWCRSAIDTARLAKPLQITAREIPPISRRRRQGECQCIGRQQQEPFCGRCVKCRLQPPGPFLTYRRHNLCNPLEKEPAAGRNGYFQRHRLARPRLRPISADRFSQKGISVHRTKRKKQSEKDFRPPYDVFSRSECPIYASEAGRDRFGPRSTTAISGLFSGLGLLALALGPSYPLVLALWYIGS